MRELQFVLGNQSFYTNHHRDIDILVHDESPFQTGDLYVFGGDLDEKGLTLTYEKAIKSAARLIFYQANQDVAEKLPPTPAHSGQVSTVNVSYFGAQGDNDLYASQRSAIYDVLLRNLLLDVSSDFQPVTNYVTPPLEADDTNQFRNAQREFDDALINTGLTADETTGNRVQTPRQILAALEQLYIEALGSLRRYALIIENSIQFHTDQRIAALNPNDETGFLAQARQQPNITLPALGDMYRYVMGEFSNMREEYRVQVQELQLAAADQAEDLRVARVRLAYNLTSFRQSPFLLMATLIVIIVAVMFFVANLWVQLALWIGASIITLPTLILYYISNRQQGARSRYIDYQRQMLNTQLDIARTRTGLQYLTKLNQYLEQSLMNGNKSLTDLIIEAVQTTRDEINDTNAANVRDQVQINDGKWQEIAPVLVNQLWQLATQDSTSYEALREELGETYLSASAEAREDLLQQVRAEKIAQNLRSEQIKATLDTIITRYDLFQRDDFESNLLINLIDTNLDAVAPLTSTNVTQIDEDFQTITHRFAFLSNWTKYSIDKDEVQEFVDNKNLTPIVVQKHIDDIDEDERPVVNSTWTTNSDATKAILLVALRTHVPFRALLYIERWRDAYRNVSRVDTIDDYFYYRNHLHPERWGVASPDIHLRRLPMFDDLSVLMMAIVTIMRYAGALTYIQRYCQRLHIYYEPTNPDAVDYDALCGAMQEDRNLQQDLLRDVTRQSTDSTALDNMLNDMRHEPIFASERYAMWEVWARERIQEIAVNPSDKKYYRLLCQIANLFIGNKDHEQ